MQRGYKLLIIGTAILAIGIILIGIMFVILKQSSFSINTSIETISPGKSAIKTSDVKAGTKMAIAVTYQPPEVPLNVQVVQEPGLSKILDANFTNKLFANFMPNKDGAANIIITNLGSNQVSANTIFGNSEFFDANGQPSTILSATAIAGPLLSFVGIVVLIVGGVILFIERRRARREKKFRE